MPGIFSASCWMSSVKSVGVHVVPWRGEAARKGHLPTASPPDITMQLFTALSEADVG